MVTLEDGGVALGDEDDMPGPIPADPAIALTAGDAVACGPLAVGCRNVSRTTRRTSDRPRSAATCSSVSFAAKPANACFLP